MSVVTGARPVASGSAGAAGPTLASTWLGISGSPIDDELLDWPPDVFALTNVLLTRSEAFRFVLSPPPGAAWPPDRFTDWGLAVQDAARRWGRRVEDRDRCLPELVAEEWSVLREAIATPLEALAEGERWPVCEALLTLHAIADEACAGLFVALDRSDGQGSRYRARGRELLATKGSLARMHPQLLRVLPKIRTPPTGRAGFSRYACVVHGAAFDTHWHKLPARHPGTDPQAEHANMLLLPWPMRVRASDFRAVPDSVQRLQKEPFGCFAFAPEERLDLDLVDRTLLAAIDEVGSVDVVVLPESAIDESEILPLEAVLERHGVVYLQAGVRGGPTHPGGLGSNWMHIGINPTLEKVGPGHSASCGPWFHLRQSKHHRWSLDAAQISQYNLGSALHPDIQWWEAMDVPRRSIQFVQVGEEITVVCLVCEDLAQDDAAEVIRSVGPTIVLAALLDGPQLPSRWGARYAGVLADDPGSSVLTLTSFGMAQRSRPQGHDPSRVVALWKDPTSGTREIALEPGAHGVVLTLVGERTTRRSADGRLPVDTGTHYYDVAVNQIRAAEHGSGTPDPRPGGPTPTALEVGELTVLTGWAEGVAEALAYAPVDAGRLLADAQGDASWRTGFGLAEPTPRLGEAFASIGRALAATTPAGGLPSFDGLLDAVCEPGLDDSGVDGLVRRVLRSTLEQLQSRRAHEPGRGSDLMVQALEDDALVHEAPAIVSSQSPSALAHAAV
jgi:hypothetical protein